MTSKLSPQEKAVAKAIRTDLAAKGWKVGDYDLFAGDREVVGQTMYDRNRVFKFVRVLFTEQGPQRYEVAEVHESNWYTQDWTVHQQVLDRSPKIWREATAEDLDATDSYLYKGQQQYNQLTKQLISMGYDRKIVGAVSRMSEFPLHSMWASLTPDNGVSFSVNVRIYFDGEGFLEIKTAEGHIGRLADEDYKVVDAIPFVPVAERFVPAR